MLKHAKCYTCGDEFEYEYSGGRERRYCSVKCKDVRDNKAFKEKATDLGVNYWTWRYRNDPEYRARRVRWNTECVKKIREKRRVEQRDLLLEKIRAAETLEEAISLFEEKARMRSETYANANSV